MKNILSVSKIILITVIFIGSSLFTSNAQASEVLGVTDITAVKTFAEAGGGYEKGWSWVFDITVPTDETVLNMKFADWLKGSDKIPAGSNIRFYSEQSSNASTTNSAIVISAGGTYSGEMYINRGIDLDTKAGRQIQITVEARIPEGSAGGSYSTSYGIKSNPDTAKPVITLLGEASPVIEVGSSYTDAGATAWDNIDGNLTPTLSGTVNSAIVGVYTIKYNIKDSVNNNADEVVRTVHVTDTVAPTITAPADITEEATGKETVVVLGKPTVTDIGDATPHISDNAPVAFPLGETIVIWTAKDASGNSATTSQKVTIVDTTKPVITLKGDSTVNVPVFGIYTEEGANVSDNYDSNLVPVITGEVDVNNVGPYTVHYNITDSNGNVAEEVTRTVIVDARPITVTAKSGIIKIFNGSEPKLDYTYTGSLHGDDSFTGSLDRDIGENVDSYNINQGTLALNKNYKITFISSILTIMPAPTVVTLGNLEQTYGATGAVTVTTDPGNISTKVTYNDSDDVPTNAGEYKVVATINNQNYEGHAEGNLIIKEAEVIVSATGGNKTYDGTLIPGDSFKLDVTGAVSGDTLTATGDASFVDKKAENDKTVTVENIKLVGDNASNYAFNETTTTKANISKKDLTVTAIGHDKVYDGLSSATVNLTSNGIVNGDDLTIIGVAQFTNSKVSPNKTVSVGGIQLNGKDKDNYSLINETVETTANITQKPLTISGLTAKNKPYDGTVEAELITGAEKLDGVITIDGVKDIVILSGTPVGNFIDKTVKNNKTIIVSDYTIEGADSGNYSLVQPTGLTADITKATLVGSITAEDKSYDGTDIATIQNRSINGKIGDDNVSYIGGTAIFSDKNFGTWEVTAIGLSLSGVDAGNYTVNSTTTTTAQITQRPLTVTAIGHEKVYDGNNTAIVDLTTNAIYGDTVIPHGVSYLFNINTVGEARLITVGGIYVTGNDIGNYKNPNSTTTTTANIIKATPVVIWDDPADIEEGTALGDTQLNAKEVNDLIGKFSYSPESGTIFPVGQDQILSVTFTPSDAVNYNTVTKIVEINVTLAPVITISSIDSIADINVVSSNIQSGGNVGVEILRAANMLNTTSNVHLSDGTTRSLNVIWRLYSSGGGDGNNYIGTWSFAGTLDLPSGITNPNNLTPDVKVIVIE